jgi:hypothetical protein
MKKKKDHLSHLKDVLKKYRKAGAPNNKAAIRDLLTDVNHYCEANGFDFNEISFNAVVVYAEEVMGQSILVSSFRNPY